MDDWDELIERIRRNEDVTPKLNFYVGTKPAPAENRVVPCRRYSRIVGYLTAVEDWNPGKRQEFAERVVFKTAQDNPGDAQERSG